MAIIAPENAAAKESRVRRKGNNTKKLRVDARKKASKAAGGAPEVMAKVTGFSKGGSHARSNIDYISRNGDLEIENERGEVIQGRKELKEFSKSWTSEMPEASGRRKAQRDTMHLVLSMPAGTPPEAVKEATRNFAKRTFGANYEYVFALHTPETDVKSKQPHCHLTVKCRGRDGQVLNPRKKDLQAYREGFAKAMEEQGVAANATRRETRGVVKKSIKQEILHIQKRGVSKVQALKLREVAQELKAEAQGLKVDPKPWIKRIEEKQARVRAAWKAMSEALGKTTERKLGHDRPDYARAGRSGATRVQPDYGRIDRERARELQRRFAGVHQPGNPGDPRPRQAGAVASVRDLPGVPVVQDKAAAQVLLHQDARGSLANRDGRAAYSAVRRSGNGVDGHERGSGGLNEAGAVGRHRMDDKALSRAAQELLKRMPPVETERDELKRQLIEQFGKSKVQAKAQEVAKAPQVEAQQVPTKAPQQQTAPPQPAKEKDLDR